MPSVFNNRPSSLSIGWSGRTFREENERGNGRGFRNHHNRSCIVYFLAFISILCNDIGGTVWYFFIAATSYLIDIHARISISFTSVYFIAIKTHTESSQHQSKQRCLLERSKRKFVIANTLVGNRSVCSELRRITFLTSFMFLLC